MPDMIHNDRGTDFLSEETQNFLLNKNIATSKTSRYNPKCNGQVEKLNGTLWKAIQVTLHARNLKSSDWETVLPDALHSIRSLLCTTTNATPHERMFNYSRKSTSGKTIPSWVKPGPIYVRNPTRGKYDPPVSPATLLHANPSYAHVRLQSGTETTVSIRDIARVPLDEPQNTALDPQHSVNETSQQELGDHSDTSNVAHGTADYVAEPLPEAAPTPQISRRSERTSKLPSKFADFEMS